MANPPKRVRKAVLPAAGLGTRFLPATKAQPKEMLPVVDKPLIQYVVEECVASGIDNIIVVTPSLSHPCSCPHPVLTLSQWVVGGDSRHGV